MKKQIFWLAAGVLAISISVSGYVASRGALKPDVVGAKTADSADSGAAPRPSPDSGTATDATDAKKETETSRGIASFYGVNTNGTRTASGILLDDSVSTAAHRTLPFGTLVRVTNLVNGLAETVEITDRGPFIKKRIIDVSRNAAEKLGMIQAGVVFVEIEVLSEGSDPSIPVLAED
jgi:rare lipoprotein A